MFPLRQLSIQLDSPWVFFFLFSLSSGRISLQWPCSPMYQKFYRLCLRYSFWQINLSLSTILILVQATIFFSPLGHCCIPDIILCFHSYLLKSILHGVLVIFLKNCTSDYGSLLPPIVLFLLFKFPNITWFISYLNTRTFPPGPLCPATLVLLSFFLSFFFFFDSSKILVLNLDLCTWFSVYQGISLCFHSFLLR